MLISLCLCICYRFGFAMVMKIGARVLFAYSDFHVCSPQTANRGVGLDKPVASPAPR